MRLFVFYDLPVVTKLERKRYAQFHNYLLKDGYDMIQFSVYARICNGLDSVNKHVQRLTLNAPDVGSVRWMQVTEKQFTEMKVVVGKKKVKEDPKFAAQLSFF
jgi:CRISPR-associated protein Cas2